LCVDKVDWLAPCIAQRVVGAVFVIFFQCWCTILHSPAANGKQGAIPEEMFQTLLANKKPENLD
jgi:hypothetical protein